MRNSRLVSSSYIGVSAAVFVLLFATSVHAATYTTDTVYPFVNGITLRSSGNIISQNQKTNQDVYVVLSVDPGPGGGGVAYSAGYEQYPFTDNGTFTFEFSNSLGATGSSSVTIDNIDRTPPEISIEPYATSSTNQDVTVVAHTNEGTLNATSHVFTENGVFDFVAEDEAGNVSTSTVTISHIDKMAPVITLQGSAHFGLRTGTTYVDFGAQASDAVDGPVAVTLSGSVDTDTPGIYTLTYDAQDAAGNNAVSVTRTVEVSSRSSGGGSSRVSTSSSTSSAAPVGRVLGASTYNFTTDLALKDSNEDVKVLQSMLAEAGFFSETPTGYFGVKTEAAVRLYQAAHGIPQTGVCGPITRAMLSGQTVSSAPSPAPASLNAQIAALLAQVEVLKAKLASLSV